MTEGNIEELSLQDTLDFLLFVAEQLEEDGNEEYASLIQQSVENLLNKLPSENKASDIEEILIPVSDEEMVDLMEISEALTNSLKG